MRVVFSLFIVLLFVSVECGNGTTETIRNTECGKPTTLLMRRSQKSDSSELIQTGALRSRRSKHKLRSDIWKWDYWCQMQPTIGKCAEKKKKYYYHSQFDTCKPFTYSGCGGNKNNFNTIKDCESRCKGTTYSEVDKDKSKTCLLQPHSGLCLALMNMFYYDVNKNKCFRFMYGGCGGNGNRFVTGRKCQTTCVRGLDKDSSKSDSD